MFSEAVKKVCNHFKDKNKLGLRHHKFYNQIKSETDFLPEKTNISQRFWHILNNTKDIPKCLECGIKEVKWYRQKKVYYTFCSYKCTMNNKSIKEKQLIRDKVKKTSLKRYGVENAMKLKKYRDKLKQTNLDKYGVDNPMKLKKYRDKLMQSNLVKYGVEYTSQKHLSKDSLEKLNDPDYLKEQHHIKKKNLTEIAKELGLYGAGSINIYLNKYNIPILTHFSSTGEKEVISYIRGIYQKDFPTNTRHIITPLELDIYLEDLKLAVEFNGNYWHSDFKKDKDYHFNKMKLCYEKNIRLINVYEWEWESNKEEIKYWLKKFITNNLDDIITKDVYLKDIADKKEFTLSLNWPINYELLKKNNFKFKKFIKPKVIKIKNFYIYDAGQIILKL